MYVCKAIARHLGFLCIHCVQKTFLSTMALMKLVLARTWGCTCPFLLCATLKIFDIWHLSLYHVLMFVMAAVLLVDILTFIFTVLLFYHGVWPNVEPHSRPSFRPQGFIRRSCLYSWIITGAVCFRDIHCYDIKYPLTFKLLLAWYDVGIDHTFLLTSYLSFPKFFLCLNNTLFAIDMTGSHRKLWLIVYILYGTVWCFLVVYKRRYFFTPCPSTH